MRIVDPKGLWYKNNGQFRITDPDSATTFEPQELTKATATTWLKGQPTMEVCPDPLKEPAEVPKPVAKK